MEWGTTFNTLHENHFPQRPLAPVRVNSGRIALDIILNCGGAAYLPQTVVTKDIQAGQLFAVENAPRIEMKAYAAYSLHGEHRDLIKQSIAFLN